MPAQQSGIPPNICETPGSNPDSQDGYPVLAFPLIFPEVPAANFFAPHAFQIGIRLALGAERRVVLRMVFRQGLYLASWGVIIGLLLAAAAAQLLSSLLYGISTLDPVTFAGVPVVVLVVYFHNQTEEGCFSDSRQTCLISPQGISGSASAEFDFT
jgi:hypothetical protein